MKSSNLPSRIVPSIGRYAGVECWHFAGTDRLIPVVRGGEGPTTPPAPAPPAPAPAAPPASPPTQPAPGAPAPQNVNMSQEQLNALLAREADQGRRAAERSLAETLGCTPEEAKARLDKAAEDERAKLSELEKAKADAEAEKLKATAATTAAAAERHAAAVERALLRAGVSDALLDKVGRMLDVEPGAKAEAITAAVDALKTEVPSLFEASSTDPPRPAPSSNPGGGPPKPRGDEDRYASGYDAGRAAARPARRNPLAPPPGSPGGQAIAPAPAGAR